MSSGVPPRSPALLPHRRLLRGRLHQRNHGLPPDWRLELQRSADPTDRRFKNGLLLNFSYTYSRAFDDSTADVNFHLPQSPSSAELSRTFGRNTRGLTSTTQTGSPGPLFMMCRSSRTPAILLKNLVGNLESRPIYTFQSPQYTSSAKRHRFQPQQRLRYGPHVHQPERHSWNRLATVVPVVNPSIACPAGTAFPAASTAPPSSAPNCNANTLAILPAPSLCRLPQSARAFSIPIQRHYYVQGGLGTLPTAARNTLPLGRINNFDVTALKRFSYHDRYKLGVPGSGLQRSQSFAISSGLTRARSTQSARSRPGGSNFTSVSRCQTSTTSTQTSATTLVTCSLLAKFNF